MITVSNLSLTFGDKTIFDQVNFVIKPNRKIGLVGKNGAGKSTFFKILVGELLPETGSISFPNNTKVGYLSQFLSLDESLTVKEGAQLAFQGILELEEELNVLNVELGTREDYESDTYADLIDKITALSLQLENMGKNQKEGELEKVLSGLGFTQESMYQKISELSGGWKMRVELAKLLLEQPDLLLLDEPINHLDIESIIWLEKWLLSYPGTYMIIAHDQEFLDNTVTEILEVSGGDIVEYRGNYSKFLVEKEQRNELTKSAFENQQKIIAQKEKLIDKFRAKASKASFAKSLTKELERMDKIDYREESQKAIRFDFRKSIRENQVVCSANDISKVYGEHVVLKNLNFKIERGDKVAFVGQNGQGKSTFAKILINKLKPSSGEAALGSNVQLAYFAQDAADQLPRNKSLLEYMEESADEEMRKKVRSILGAFMFSGDFVDNKISVLSGGEKNRLAFAHLLLEPFNFLVLDEPTHHLDIDSKERFREALRQFDGTLLIISHDRTFLDGLTNKTIEFKNQSIKTYLGDIRYFLHEREAESMREIEQKQKLTKTSSSDNKLRTKDVRNQQKELGRLENKIEKIEKQIVKIEDQMMVSDFYKAPNFQDVTNEHSRLKSQLKELMQEWEKTAENL